MKSESLFIKIVSIKGAVQKKTFAFLIMLVMAVSMLPSIVMAEAEGITEKFKVDDMILA